MNQLVFIENNTAFTDSLVIAEMFDKDHDKVVRDIEKQVSKLVEADEAEWGVANFGVTHYQHPQNKQWYPKYNLTEDGFAIVAMSYTTVEAMKMKVKFIQEFKRMREFIQQQEYSVAKKEPTHPWFIKWLKGQPIVTLHDFNQLVGLEGKQHKKLFRLEYFKPGADWNGLGQGALREEFEKVHNVHYEEETFIYMYPSGVVKALNILEEENKISAEAKQAILEDFKTRNIEAKKAIEVKETKEVYTTVKRLPMKITIALEERIS